MNSFTRRSILGLGVSLPFISTALYADSHATVHEVSIEGFAFSPAVLEVAVGDVVKFTNLDGAPHTATANNGAFDTGRLKRGESFELTVTDAGEHPYFCTFHRSMTATITAS